METKTKDEWRERLSPEQFEICRNKGTERAFSGEYYDCKDPGTYRCICCGNELFAHRRSIQEAPPRSGRDKRHHQSRTGNLIPAVQQGGRVEVAHYHTLQDHQAVGE